MFWRKSRASTSEPEKLRKRLENIFDKSRVGHLFTLEDLTDEIQANEKDSVAFLLGQLASRNIVDQIIRVESPRGGGIADYTSPEQVPEEVFDPFQLKDIHVVPSLIRVYFTKHKDERDREGSISRSHALV